MRIVLQRVSEARVEVDGQCVGEIQYGLLLLVGVHRGDALDLTRDVAHKVVHLRIFADEEGRMNRSLLDVGGALLAVSQFTLAGSTKKGRRPSFDSAAAPSDANAWFELFCKELREYGVSVATGTFGASMQVSLINDGPVTFVLDSESP